MGSCVSCANEVTEVTENTSETTEESHNEMLDLIVGGASKYEIIYPERARACEENFTNRFAELFSEKTGIDLPKKDDFLKRGESEETDTYKIYVGYTNRSLSAEAYKALRYRDCRIVTSGSNIVLAAHTDAGFDDIIRWFKNDC